MIRIFTDPRCLAHRPPPGFPERPERLERVLAHLRGAGFELSEAPRDPATAAAAEDAVLALHDAAYVERFERAVARRDGLLDSADNPLSPGSWDAVWGATETAIRAADWVMGQPGRAAFAAVRPPGHHAERATAMGFCYFNHAAVAAEHLRRRHGIAKVAVLDFDVHHGNGTQHLFEERADVVYLSVHQSPFYPGTGGAGETGRGAGAGATLNVPLAAGSGDERYRRVFEGELLPALRRHAPEMLVLSAGFDAWQGDPLGGMRVSLEGYEQWGRWLAELAGELCSGRTLSLLEGGYDLAALPLLVERYLRGLDALPTEAFDAAGVDG